MSPRWLTTLRELFTQEQRDADLARELRAHLDAEAEERIADGVPPDEARFAARRALGNPTAIRERARDGWTWGRVVLALRALLIGVRQDGRFAVRTFAGQPGFTAAAVLALGLGIGATTTIYSVIQGVLLDPYPMYRQVDRIVGISVIDLASGRAARARRVPDIRAPRLPGPGDVVLRDHRRQRRRRALVDAAGHRAVRRRRHLREHLLVHGGRRRHRPGPDPGRRDAGRVPGLRHESPAVDDTVRAGPDHRQPRVHLERHPDDAGRHHARAHLEARGGRVAAAAAGSRRSGPGQSLLAFPGPAQARRHARGCGGGAEHHRAPARAALSAPVSGALCRPRRDPHRQCRRPVPDDALHDGGGGRPATPDRVHQRRQHAPQPRGRPRAGDGRACLARRQPCPSRPAADGREPAARAGRRRPRLPAGLRRHDRRVACDAGGADPAGSRDPAEPAGAAVLAPGRRGHRRPVRTGPGAADRAPAAHAGPPGRRQGHRRRVPPRPPEPRARHRRDRAVAGAAHVRRAADAQLHQAAGGRPRLRSRERPLRPDLQRPEHPHRRCAASLSGAGAAAPPCAAGRRRRHERERRAPIRRRHGLLRGARDEHFPAADGERRAW